MNNVMKRTTLALTLLAAIATTPAGANIRRFTYTYESAVLPPGHTELEPWITWRAGRNGFYSRFDNRLEYERGVTNRLMTAFYLNWHRETEKDLPGLTKSTSDFDGFSSEWKYKILDPAADAIGFAGYGEISFNTDEAELEIKLIFDKVVGDFLTAYNFIFEPEMKYESGKLALEEFSVQHAFGISYAFSPKFSMGLETWQHTDFDQDGLLHAAIFAGPVLSYVSGEFWVTLTVLGQLPAIKRSAYQPSSDLVLDTHEQVNTRLLIALPF